jgi:acetolactate synthase-1/2/3 large subunit
VELTAAASRPVWLLGGGVSRNTADELHDELGVLGVPVMTTWNGADRVARDLPTYVGRPNTWGQRSANALLSQADLVVAFGTRLGLQQTGFAWEEFAPLATVVQVDLDRAELEKGHPRVDVGVQADADDVLRGLVAGLRDRPASSEHATWLRFCRDVRKLLPLRDPANRTGPGFVCPYRFSERVADLLPASAIFVPCSSGGANSVPMQVFEPSRGHTLVTDPGLASMGYGLAGAVGAALAGPGRPVVLVEGDGGFAQNLSELGTVAAQRLDLTIFLFCNDGYGSIRTTQRNYMGGAYVGCDARTGLGLPDWHQLFAAYGIPVTELRPQDGDSDAPDLDQLAGILAGSGPRAVLVPIDPEQTYWPKITSRITETGSMVSRPLHDMSPDLPDELADRVLPYLRTGRS